MFFFFLEAEVFLYIDFSFISKLAYIKLKRVLIEISHIQNYSISKYCYLYVGEKVYHSYDVNALPHRK